MAVWSVLLQHKGTGIMSSENMTKNSPIRSNAFNGNDEN